MQNSAVWGEPESTFLKNFFDEVDKTITEEMQSSESVMEESLTFVLARLLDGKSTFQRLLDYSLQQLNDDLERCGSGSRVTIEFETNEHKKSFESSVSFADLGIILKRDHSIFGPSYTKAIIVQSKKLYPRKDSYRIHCGYDAFDIKQFQGLKKIASKYGWRGVLYFLYNPKLHAFHENDAKILKALESKLVSSFAWPSYSFPYWHPDIEYIIHKFARRGLFPGVMGSTTTKTDSPDKLLELREKSISFKPGLRVLGISDVANLVEAGKSVKNSFRLEECYRYAMSDRWLRNRGTVPFLSLSSYFVDLFMACSHGSDNKNLIRIAEGRIPEPEGDNDDDIPRIAARHTIKIAIRSTLPQMDVSFHQ